MHVEFETVFETFNIIAFSESEPSNRFQVGTGSRFGIMQLKSDPNPP